MESEEQQIESNVSKVKDQITTNAGIIEQIKYQAARDQIKFKLEQQQEPVAAVPNHSLARVRIDSFCRNDRDLVALLIGESSKSLTVQELQQQISEQVIARRRNNSQSFDVNLIDQ